VHRLQGRGGLGADGELVTCGGGRLKSRSGGSASEGETSASAENLKIKLIAAEGQHDERAKLHMLWAIRLFIRRIGVKAGEIGRSIGSIGGSFAITTEVHASDVPSRCRIYRYGEVPFNRGSWSSEPLRSTSRGVNLQTAVQVF